MTELATGYVAVKPDAKGFGNQLGGAVEGETRSAGRRIGIGFGKALVAGALVAAAGIGVLAAQGVEEAREANRIGAVTAQVIKSTGGAANLSATQVGNLANAISLKTGIDDEAIQSGQNLLLTFKNVRNEVGKGNDVFARATQAGVDLAATGFGSIEGNAKMLGKALNDPEKGLTALTRAGVTFTAAQKDQIGALVESGDILKAQKIILGEVESQVGGAAAAAATDADKAQVAFGNLKEEIGQQLIPIIDAGARAFTNFAPQISSAIGGIGPAFDRARAFIAPFVEQVLGFFQGSGGSAIAAFGSQIQTIFTTSVLPVLQQAGDTFRNVVLPAVTSLVSYLASSLFPVFQQVAGIVTGQVIPILASLAAFVYGTLYPAVIRIVAAIAQNLKPVFDQVVATLRADVLPAISQLLDAFQRAQPTIQRVVMVVVAVIGAVLKFAAAILAKVLPVVIRLVGFIISKLVPVLISVVGAVAKVVGALIRFGGGVVDAVQKVIEFQRKVSEKVGAVVDFFAKVPGKIKKVFTDPLGLLKTIGSQIIEGLKKGIEAGAEKVLSAVRAIIDKIPKFIRDKLGISSPSRVTTYLGRMIGDGLADGLEKSGSKVDKAAQKLVDRLRSKLDNLLSASESLASGVAGAFTGNLFQAETFGGFLSNLLDTKGQLTQLKAAFSTLLGWGFKPEFLSQLFQSGNGGLILDLASQTQADAQLAASTFKDVMNLAGDLGGDVAGAKFGDKIDGVRQEIKELRKDLKENARETGREVGAQVNGAARGGRRLARAT